VVQTESIPVNRDGEGRVGEKENYPRFCNFQSLFP
jgi:hypothetical protein